MTIKQLMGENLPEFEIVDIHAHMNRPAQFMCPGDPDIDGMIAVCDRVGISRIAIAPNMAINCDSPLGNDMVLAAAEKYPDRVIGLATVNFNDFDACMENLEKCFDTPHFKGVKLHPDFMNYSIQDHPEKMHTVMEFCQNKGAFLISHTDDRLFPGHLVHYSRPVWFEPYIKQYKTVNFMLAHCALSAEGYQVCLRLAKENKNVYLDTTGFRFSSTWTVDDLARNGLAEQVVFGTDIPFNDIGSAGGRIILSELPLEVRIRMMGENARRMMGEI